VMPLDKTFSDEARVAAVAARKGSGKTLMQVARETKKTTKVQGNRPSKDLYAQLKAHGGTDEQFDHAVRVLEQSGKISPEILNQVRDAKLQTAHDTLHEALQGEESEDSLSDNGAQAFHQAIKAFDADPRTVNSSELEDVKTLLNNRMATPGDHWTLAKLSGKKV